MLGSASSGKFAEMAPVFNRAGILQVAIISTAVRVAQEYRYVQWLVTGGSALIIAFTIVLIGVLEPAVDHPCP